MKNKKAVTSGVKVLVAPLIAMGFAVCLPQTASAAARQAVQQQDGVVKGHVVDENGEPLIGVTVRAKGGQATITDIDGNYTINVPKGTPLTISYTGYKDMQTTAGATVSMTPDVQGLDDVVVIGYGTAKKRDLTGSISQVNADQLKDRPYGNALQSMAGQVSGVNITTTQGAPGMAPTVKVRGMSSINSGTSPLYVIDGIPLEDNTNSGDGANGGNVQIANRNPLNNINPNDIESIEVLKDASSAAIYGSRGANGVVIITTKTGKAGKTKVDVNYEFGISRVNRRIDLMNAPEWMDYETAARNNSYATAVKSNPSLKRTDGMGNYYIPDEFNDPEWKARIGNGTDWQDVLLHTAHTHNVQVSVSGGSEKTQFMISGNYLNQEGVVDNNPYERYSFRSNINHKFNDHISVSMKLAMTHTKDKPQGLSGKSDAVSLANQSDPIFPKFVETGNLGFKDPNSMWNTFVKYGFQLWHPYSLTREMNKDHRTDTQLMNTYVDWKIIDGLVFRSALSADNEDMHYSTYWNTNQGYGYSGAMPATGSFQTLRQFNWAWENTLNYNQSFGDHTITGLLGYTMQKQTLELSNMNANNFPNDMVHTLNAGKVNSGSTSKTAWSILSYLARATYSYKGKYLASAAIRADGCSRFGKDNRWGYFPSASLAWRASEESFLSNNVDWLNNLKFRLSYGQTGNNQIDNYGAIGLLDYSSYVANGNVVQGMYTSTKPSPKLKWEKTWQVNFGIDFSVLRDRIGGSLDLYYSRTNDLLLNVPVPVITGFETQLDNVGSLRNQGVEFNINSRNFVGEFTWTTDFNISANRNKVLKLGQNDDPIYVNTNSALSKTEVGQPIGNYFGYKAVGVLSTAEANQLEANGYNNGNAGWSAPSGSEAGDPKYLDANGDGKISADDRVILGNYQPNFTWGMTNTFTYKGFDFSFMLTGSEGGEIMNQNARYLGEWNGSRGGYKSLTKYWRSDENPGDGITPKPRTVTTGVRGQSSSYWVEDGSFWRLKNIRLGYTFPRQLVNKIGMTNLRIYCNLENVYVHSDYRNYDPENSTFQTGYRVGYDYGAYPTPFTCSFGINLTF